MRKCGWTDIDFLKIDAEGEEAAIIQGDRDFFHTQSPLINFEIKSGAGFKRELVRAFSTIGYQSYRLLLGLGVLVPFNVHEAIGNSFLNLYCCKPDPAAKLAAADRLVLANDPVSTVRALHVDHLNQGGAANSIYGWQNTLERLPYGRVLSPTWQNTVGIVRSSDVEKALALRAIAHDQKQPVAERCLALATSFRLLLTVCVLEPGHLRLANRARVAR